MLKTTQYPLWPCWVQPKLIIRALQSLVPSTEQENDDFCSGKTSTDEEELVDNPCMCRGGNGTYYKAQQEEACFVNSNNHHKYIEEDTCTPVSLVSLLKDCAQKKDIHRGSQLHSTIARRGFLHKNVFLGSTLVHMYARCGALAKAQEVFDELSMQNVVLWNSLITAYAQHGCGEEALNCFEKMQCEGLSPDAFTFTCTLKACGGIRDLEKGQEIHDCVVKYGLLEKDMVIGTALVDMYAKCGFLGEAQKVFDELPTQNFITWNALISGYAQHGHGEEALECFERMQLAGLSPNAVTFVSLLQSCGSIGASDKGQDMHATIVRDGLLQKEEVGTAVVDMYIKCGMLEKAEEVFVDLLVRNEVSWNALIAGYAQKGYGEEAVNYFTRMHCEGLCPDIATFTCTLKGCGSIGFLDEGQKIHAQIVGDGLLEKEITVGTALVDMYAKCGLIGKAQEVFNKLPDPNVVSWTALIGGYAQHGQCNEALKCFQRMQSGGVYPNAATFACILKACGSVGASVEGQEIHAQIVRSGLLKKGVVGTALVDMYTKCGLLGRALEVFEELPIRDIVLWNGLIAGYAHHGHGEEALEVFEKMQLGGLSPNAVTFGCILKACCSLGASNNAHDILAQILKNGLLEKDIAVANALVNMHVKCGLLGKAQEVFNELPNRDVVSWNTLLTGYIKHGHGKEALHCFEQMQGEGATRDAITFACILKACGRIDAGNKGKEIHAQILRDGLLEKDVLIGTALVDMYVKCGMLAEAQEVFDELPVQDVVLWNVLIAGYTQRAHGEEALDCLERMQCGGFSPNSVTLSCVLKACGSIGAVNKGQEIHDRILKEGLLEEDMVVGNTLVDMYANCGMVVEAQDMFDKLAVRGIVSWNALIAGYAQLGNIKIVFDLFDKMIGEGQNPDTITFTSVLNACSHMGLLDEGRRVLASMCTSYGVNTTLEHYTCMIDSLGRAGRLDHVAAVLNGMPFSASLLMWHTVLGACQKFGNVELGRWAFDHAMHLDDKDVAAYVCMCNVFAAAGRHEDVLMKEVQSMAYADEMKAVTENSSILL